MSNGRIVKGAETVLFVMPFLENTAPQRTEQGEGTAEVLPGQRIEEIEREAYERGFASGEKAGFEMGDHKAVVLLNRLEKIITGIAELKENLTRELEPQIMELALAIARKIVLEELALNPEAVVRIVKEALRKIEKTGQITIKITPSLKDLFLRLRPDLLEIHPDIVYDFDPSASATGPLVTGAREEVVTDLDAQLSNISEQIGAELGPH